MSKTTSELVLKIDSRGAEGNADRMTRKTGALKKKGDEASGSFKGLGSRLEGFGKIAGAVAGAAAVGAVVSSLAGAVGRMKDFNAAMAEVSTLLDDTSGMDELERGIREIARQFGGDITENAKAAYGIISAGASSTAEALELLAAANQVALGGVTDVETAASGLSASLNAYGESADQAGDYSDILFTAMKKGTTTIGELASNLGSTAPLAAALNVPFDELLASVSAITKGGRTTSEAFTQVRGILTAIVKPTTEATKVADELGIEFNAAALEADGLNGFLRKMIEATGGNIETLGRMFGSVEALNGAVALTAKEGAVTNDILAAMENRAGATAEAVGKMEGSLTFQWEKLKGNFRALGDAIVSYIERPLINALNWLNRLFERFTGWLNSLSRLGSSDLGPDIQVRTDNAFSSGTRRIDQAFQDSYQGSLGTRNRDAISLNGLRTDVRQLSQAIYGSGDRVVSAIGGISGAGLVYR